MGADLAAYFNQGKHLHIVIEAGHLLMAEYPETINGAIASPSSDQALQQALRDRHLLLTQKLPQSSSYYSFVGLKVPISFFATDTLLNGENPRTEVSSPSRLCGSLNYSSGEKGVIASETHKSRVTLPPLSMVGNSTHPCMPKARQTG